MRSRRLLLLAAGVGGAAIVAVVLILVASSGSSNSTTTTTPATASPDAGSSAAGTNPVSLFAGIPQHGDTLGKASAPATLEVFEDPQCPYCRDWSVNTLPTIVRDFVRPGKLKLVYRGIGILGPGSQPGLRAIFAAGLQNKLWNLADALYDVQGAENSGWITNGVIRGAAKAAGARSSAILAATSSKAVAAALGKANSAALAYRVPGTPAFVVQRPPALPQALNVTSLSPDSFSAVLSAALQ
jgi:protein-disulfide isomerase